MFEIQVSLVKKTLTAATFANHFARVEFQVFVTASGGGIVPIRQTITAAFSPEGIATLELPDPGAAAGNCDATSPHISVLGPDGSALEVALTSPVLQVATSISVDITGKSSPVSVVLTVDPAPDTTVFRVKVIVTPKTAVPSPDYAGHRVVAAFTRAVALEDGRIILLTGKISGELGRDGVFDSLSLPGLANLRGQVDFYVYAPDGSQLASVSRDVQTDLLPSLGSQPFIETIVVDPITKVPLGLSSDPGFGKPSKIRGRVIDEAGEIDLSGRQLLIFGKPVPSSVGASPPEFVPLLVTTTVATGYFTAPYPVGRFEEAIAVLGPSARMTVPIRLEDDATFPGNLLIVVQATEEDAVSSEACECSVGVPRFPDAGDIAAAPEIFASDALGGTCVNFTKPNRTLEQFNYLKVVRTTEPEVQGLVIDDLQTVSLEFVYNGLPPDEVSASVLTALRTYIDDPNNAGLVLDVGLAEALLAEPATFTMSKLKKAVTLTQQRLSAVKSDQLAALGRQRAPLGGDKAVDWDETPTIFQATSVAHGHLLTFTQEWLADGYSLGDLLYSLPLAPGQKKNIAIVDWDRREAATRVATLEEREALFATLSRDRDVSEIITGVLNQDMAGGSSASTSSFGGGGGLGFGIPLLGGFLGIGGGGAGASSSASSSAWQRSSRVTAASDLQSLSDRTAQSAQAVRGLRSTVIQSVTQNESVAVTTEVVANNNHCHAMTVEYFEVLRHFLVRQYLSNVQECLLVPFRLSPFDSEKALRWRARLAPALRDATLAGGFAALERIQNSYLGTDFPKMRYADEEIEFIEGFLNIRFRIARPADDELGKFQTAAWAALGLLLPSFSGMTFWQEFIENVRDKDAAFQRQIGARIAEAIIGGLRFSIVRPTAVGPAVSLPVDATLVSGFVNDRDLYVSIRTSASLPTPVRRSEVTAIRISGTISVPGGPQPIEKLLPANSKVIVEGGRLRYRLQHSQGDLFQTSRLQDDLGGTDPDVLIFTPLTRDEERNPREEDQELRLRLLAHLNENLEYYHRAIWLGMNPDRRFMLLDGIVAPNSGGKSVASVVENKLIGIAGNAMIFPVVPGLNLDPIFRRTTTTTGSREGLTNLLDHYQPTTAPPLARFAVPTKGVYAEVVMGECNACEIKDESRFWRWSESPNPDSPTAIASPSTATRVTPATIPQQSFPQPIINLQNVPAAPATADLNSVMQLLGTTNAFTNITGLTENQKNALTALQSALSGAQGFAGIAGDLGKAVLQNKMGQDLDKTLKTIKSAQESNLISEEKAKELTVGAIRAHIGGGAETPATPSSTKDMKDAVNAAGANKANIAFRRANGESTEVKAKPEANTVTVDAGNASLIIPSQPEMSPDSRAFSPSTLGKSGMTTLAVTIGPNAPAGSQVAWTVADSSMLIFDAPSAASTGVRALRPGSTSVVVTLSGGAGAVLDQARFAVSVPQFVTIDEDAASLNAVLTDLRLADVKARVLQEAKAVVDLLLAPANVRTLWRMAPFTETVPTQLSAMLTTTVVIGGEPPATIPDIPSGVNPATVNGVTHPGAAGKVGIDAANETINVYTGAFDNALDPARDNSDVDPTTQALALRIKGQNLSASAMKDLAVKAFGRLLGETIAHHIGFALLGPATNNPPVAGDLMNAGAARSFLQRTGLDVPSGDPINPEAVTDRGIQNINGFSRAAHRQVFAAYYPVPPDLT